MAYTDVLDSTITLTDILVPNQPYYKDFSNSVCAFVLNIWPGLKYVNGISIELIKYLGVNYNTCKSTNIIDFESEKEFGINNIWSLPKNGNPNRNGMFADYLGYYSYQNIEKLVIYGFFDDNGYIKQLSGSLSDPIKLYIDNWNWAYYDTNSNTNRNINFPVLSGCRVDALSNRNDCSNRVIQKYFDFTNLDSSLILGDIPVAFSESGNWHWS